MITGRGTKLVLYRNQGGAGQGQGKGKKKNIGRHAEKMPPKNPLELGLQDRVPGAETEIPQNGHRKGHHPAGSQIEQPQTIFIAADHFLAGKSDGPEDQKGRKGKNGPGDPGG